MACDWPPSLGDAAKAPEIKFLKGVLVAAEEEVSQLHEGRCLGH